MEVATFIRDFVEDRQPGMIVETGCGQGYFCAGLPERTLHYEAHPDFKSRKAQRDPTPSIRVFQKADLFVLDSDTPYREREMVWWAYYGKPGSFCFVHDTGNGHHPAVYHSLLGDLVQRLDQPGWFFDNPRGSWLGVHS